jgi:hypothetical protein
MIRSFLIAAAMVVLTCAPGAAAAQSPPAQAVEIGAAVHDSEGQVLGRIESVVSDPDGRPRQVLVRTPGVAGVGEKVKTLPVRALRPRPGGYAVALRKAEFNALPSTDRR